MLRNYIKIVLFILSFCSSSAKADIADTTKTVMLGGVEVVSSVKENAGIRQQPLSVSLIAKEQMEAYHINSLKGTAILVPNFYIPDYGSRLTSAIYIRGIGSRINTPAVGLYVDDIPYIDKSAYDFNFYDIESVDVLRGPQGTLYGRNTMGGLIRVHTKNPFFYKGTDARIGYATNDNHRMISLTHYHRINNKFAFSGGGYYEGSNGFFKNSCLNKNADAVKSGGGRIRAIWLPSDRWKLDASVTYDYSDEGAYPYYYVGNTTQTESYSDLIGKICNNRESSYRRSLLNIGANLQYTADKWQMNILTGYQNLTDRMFMDQDFIFEDLYSLDQRQRMNTINEEITFKNRGSSKWEWISGINIMYQALHTTGPVNFYSDGIDWLENNINSVMPSIDNITMLKAMGFTGMSINFRDEKFVMNGTYDTPILGTALFHQSTYHFNDNLSGIVGVRFDHEHHQMKYNSPAIVDYGFTMPNAANEKMAVNLQNLVSEIGYKGRLYDNQFRVLPKIAIKYEFNKNNNIYSSVSMGQRSGGYNLQMFSDLLQGAMRVDMMNGVKEGVGNYLDYLVENNPVIPHYIPDPDNSGQMIALPEYVRRVMSENMPQFEIPSTSQVEYRPEYSWNYELGSHLTFFDNRLAFDASVFYSRIYHQQIARFAPSGLGRMMVNAGKSQSCGGEMSIRWCPNNNLVLSGDYGYTHSVFLDYDNGDGNDYKDNYVPFVPMHTMNVDATYTWKTGGRNNAPIIKNISIGANCSGAGKIYWTESNSYSQNFYLRLGARLAFNTKYGNVILWGKNLTDSKYNTFFFESAGRAYEQHGKPLQLGIDLNIHF